MLENCEPRAVFSVFEDYCAIPHPSRHTEAATAFCLAFAARHGLAAVRDAAGNVVIRKPASSGYEDHPTVILQGHLDMVAEKTPDCRIDMEKEGLSLFREGDLIGAHGTTLGGDDGIAVAMALAILADPALPHPPLEVVFTTDEEIGMLGAVAMDMSALQGRRLLNLDSEDEGVLTVSCAGGAQVNIRCPVCRGTARGTLCSVELDGLTGGHSGAEIHKNRLNAAVFLCRLVRAAASVTAVRLLSLCGGLKDNAIPCRASASFFAADPAAAEAAVRAAFRDGCADHAESDPGARLAFRTEEAEAPAVSAVDSARLLDFLMALPCGVQAMSREMPGLVQTSLNLGILQTEDAAVSLVYSVRSSVGAEKAALIRRLTDAAARAGAAYTVEGDYPAWEYRQDSPLRETVCAAYEALYGRPMQVLAIHAGLECGLFSDRLPGLDCVSLGPAMYDIHTARERLSVSSVARTYALVCDVLKRL